MLSFCAWRSILGPAARVPSALPLPFPQPQRAPLHPPPPLRPRSATHSARALVERAAHPNQEERYWVSYSFPAPPAPIGHCGFAGEFIGRNDKYTVLIKSALSQTSTSL